MKRMMAMACALLLLLCLVGCESKEEKALRQAYEAADAAGRAADQAQRDYDDLKDRFDRLDDMYDRLG